MSDVHNRETRSFNMSRIKGKDTKPELQVRQYLFAQGFRYRLHAKNLPGKPDLVLAKYNAVVFVNGCFWHGHAGCRYAHLPKTRTEWWAAKIERTQVVDAHAIEALRAAGRNVLVTWECGLKKARREETLAALKEALRALGTNSKSQYHEIGAPAV